MSPLPSPTDLRLLGELARRELAKRDFLTFCEIIHLHLHGRPLLVGDFQRHLAQVLQEAAEEHAAGLTPRDLVEAPPRHGKSQFISVFLPAWLFLRDPSLKIIVTSYSQLIASQVGRQIRAVMSLPIYQDLNPDACPDPNTASVNRLDTISRGELHAVGIGGGLTGIGADFIFVDDAIKNNEAADSPAQSDDLWQWYASVLRTRALPKAAMIQVQTRWSVDDLAGRVLKAQDENPLADRWRRWSYEAICTNKDADPLSREEGEALDPVRYPVEELNKVRASITPRAWAALFQQKPYVEQGSFFDATELEASLVPLNQIPPIASLNCYVTTDFAISEKASADWTVIAAFGVDDQGCVWVLPGTKRFKRSDSSAIDDMLNMAKRVSARELIIEDTMQFKAWRDLIKTKMRESGHFYSLTSPPVTQDKSSRAVPLRARIQQGMVKFPDDTFTRDILIPEFLAFGGRKTTTHDDVVDSFSLGVGQLTRLMRASPGKSPASANPFPASGYDPQGIDQEELKKIIEQGRASQPRSGSGSDSLVRRTRKLNGRLTAKRSE